MKHDSEESGLGLIKVLRMVDAPVEIQTRHQLNTSLLHYCYANMLSKNVHPLLKKSINLNVLTKY